MLLAHCLHLSFVTMTTLPLPDLGHEQLRKEIAGVLRSLDAPAALRLEYSTYEVLPDSVLGHQIQPMLSSSPVESVRLGELVDSLRKAATSRTQPVSEQVQELQKKGIGPHPLSSGLLVGGRPMLFQVVQGTTRTAQSCLSEPSYFSILRTREYDVTYFSEQGRLEIAPRNEDILLFTASETCFPLPVADGNVDSFTKKEWEISEPTDSTTNVSAIVGGSDSARMTIVLGGPGRRYPLHCMRQPSVQGAQYSLVAVLEWKFDGNRGELKSVLRIEQSPSRFGIVHYQFVAHDQVVSDDDCSLLVHPLKTVIDRRGQVARQLKTNELPAELSKLLMFVN